jgi:hypothetical protein
MARLALGATSAALLAAMACGGDSAPAGSATASPLSSERFEVPVSVHLADGYGLAADYPYAFMVQRIHGPSGYLLVQFLTGVYEGNSPLQTAIPDDVIAWLRDNPAIEFLAEPEAVTIGGVNGTQIDIIGRASTLLFASVGQGDEVVRLAIASGERARLIALDVEGKRVVVSGGASIPSDYFGVLPEIQQMIDTIEFQRSES